jgi:REP element-mobilizing transposase RayT
MYLKRPEIAEIVVVKLKEADADLQAWAVMPNHVHVLWTPHISNAEAIRRVKGATAIRANSVLGLTGRPFWSEEYFDRIVRNDDEFRRIRRYIDWNPVKAGLAASPEEYPWSSAFERG